MAGRACTTRSRLLPLGDLPPPWFGLGGLCKRMDTSGRGLRARARPGLPAAGGARLVRGHGHVDISARCASLRREVVCRFSAGRRFPSVAAS